MSTKTKKGKNLKVSSLKKGNVLSEQQFYTVEKIDASRLVLKNDNDESITVSNEYAESCLISAEQFAETIKVGRTEAAAIFMGMSNIAITVNFNKQVKEADVINDIMTTFDSKVTVTAKRKAVSEAIGRAMVGEERTMIGRHYGEVTELGRVKFIDMEEKRDTGKEYDNRIRQVDPRTINWFIARGIKYEVK